LRGGFALVLTPYALAGSPAEKGKKKEKVKKKKKEKEKKKKKKGTAFFPSDLGPQ
jgi:prophage tail gpP-like protein